MSSLELFIGIFNLICTELSTGSSSSLSHLSKWHHHSSKTMPLMPFTPQPVGQSSTSSVFEIYPNLITSTAATLLQVTIISWLSNLRNHVLDFFISNVCLIIKWLLVLNFIYNFSFDIYPILSSSDFIQDTKILRAFEYVCCNPCC